jgi:hypothetical protein
MDRYAFRIPANAISAVFWRREVPMPANAPIHAGGNMPLSKKKGRANIYRSLKMTGARML